MTENELNEDRKLELIVAIEQAMQDRGAVVLPASMSHYSVDDLETILEKCSN